LSKTLFIEGRSYPTQEVNGVAKKFNKPKPAEVLARIQKETQAVVRARAEHKELQGFRENFKWPLIGPITGVFGSQRVYNGVPSRPHYGVDIAAPVGTQVFAPASGVVTLAYADMYYSGGTLIIDHGYGVSSSFLHLSKVLVKPGDMIRQGDLIAEVGAGGRATGPHLDWRMNWYKRRIDPALLVPAMQAASTTLK
jgi:murein DD-endopeptidase MepM/ murein hydrolase activator NlpD